MSQEQWILLGVHLDCEGLVSVTNRELWGLFYLLSK